MKAGGREGGKADRRTGGPAGKRLPIVPIAAAALVVLAGGAYAMRGTLFGGTPIQKVDSLPAPIRPETTAVVLAGRVDTTNSLGAASQTPTKSTGTPDPGTQPARDSVRTVSNPPVTTSNPPADLGTLKAQVLRFADDIEFVDNELKRAEGKQVAQKAWSTPALGDSVRAEAAAVMGSALLKEQDPNGAKTWYQRAYSLNPRSVWQQILDGIN